jgi:tripartite-type tricarboxylate transporter receptor subunit TctC
MGRIIEAVAAGAVVVCGACSGQRVDSSAPFAGERVEIVVPFREGGGSDTWARAVAPYLQRHLGEDATVQIVNVLGASGVQGGNEFAQRRRHDGLSLFISSGSNTLPYLLGERAVRYDFKDFAGVMGSPAGGVVYVSSRLRVSDVPGLCDSSGLVYGGISPTGLDMVPLVAFELLGLDVEAVLGYQGKGAARLALEQGETNLDYQTSPAYLANVLPLVEAGEAVPLFTFGVLDSAGNVVRDPVFPDLPSFKEAFVTCHGGDPVGVEWEAYRSILTAGFAAQKSLWVHADAPPDRVDALVRAADAVIADPEFQSRAAELFGDYPFYSGEAVRKAFELATRLPPESREWLLALLRSKYDVAI